ncbi:MAG: hypothetical protein R6X06_04655 [Gammaproteobacteria bacterium]
MDEHTRSHLHETPWVVTLPLILLAIPSVVIGAFYVDSMAFGKFFGDAIYVLPQHDVLAKLAKDYHGVWGMITHGFVTAPFWLAATGVLTAYFLYMKRPDIPAWFEKKFKLIHTVLDNKYYADRFNEIFFAGGSRGIGRVLWQAGDTKLIDGMIINGSAKTVGWCSGVLRRVQTGYLYHYAFAMILGLMFLLASYVLGWI